MYIYICIHDINVCMCIYVYARSVSRDFSYSFKCNCVVLNRLIIGGSFHLPQLHKWSLS